LRIKRELLLREEKVGNDKMRLQQVTDSLKILDTLAVRMEEAGIMQKDAFIDDSVRAGILAFLQSNQMKMSTGGAQVGRIELDSLPASVVAYDSIQRQLPGNQKDHWLKRYFTRKLILLNAKFEYDSNTVVAKLSDKLLHSLPKMMFAALPFAALFVSLLYWKQTRSNYVNHGILVIHVFVAMYVFVLMLLGIDRLDGLSGWAVFDWFRVALLLYMGYYGYKSLKTFFKESRPKTIFKYLGILFLSLILFSFLTMIFVVNSLLQL
jgi:hypothetical protein